MNPGADTTPIRQFVSLLKFYLPPLLVCAALVLSFSVLLNPVLDAINFLLDPLLGPLAEIGLSKPVLQTMLVGAILALSIYITLYGGMFSLANAGFMGIGAYTGAILTKNLDGSFGASILVGMMVSGIVALMISLPVLRLRNIYLAIATIGFGEIVVVFFNRIDAVLLDLYRNNQRLSPAIDKLYKFLNVDIHVTSSGTPTKALITGGASGLKNIPQHAETAHLVLFLIVTAYVMYRLRRSRFGRALDAIRQDEKVASSLGIHVVYYKNAAFFIGALVAGAAGVFDAHLDTLIEPKDYGFNTAVDILAYAVLGGTKNWVGPVLGGLTLQGLPELFRELREYSGVITGLTLLLTIVYLPGGLSSLFNRTFWSAGGRFVMARRIAVGGLVVILIANVFPYQSTNTIQGRILGNAFLRNQARAAPIALLVLALMLFGVYVLVMWRTQRWIRQDRLVVPATVWRPALLGAGVLLALYVFYENVWYLAVGNLLPVIALFWVVRTSPEVTGGHFSVPLALIAGSTMVLWVVLGAVGAIKDVMFGYYLQVAGMAILSAACLIRYEPDQRDEPVEPERHVGTS